MWLEFISSFFVMAFGHFSRGLKSDDLQILITEKDKSNENFVMLERI